ncbi:hypothetical protein [Roseomonas populi]|uniref:Uncharacterized protein n=1 Tax=Roseomonas populi TaxID=3121582 RepID=A0ABT1XE77_9PROT|nr:hypothetical protein [Roseomonas pecuniae]MCR0985279.1 hypothetical protein [Roseomonas pecuniae]
MPTVAQFLRSTPPAALRGYFDALQAPLPPELPWDGPGHAIVAPLLQAVNDLDDLSRDKVLNDADRVGAMADEAGEAALYSVTSSRAVLDMLENSHARALWMFQHDPAGFSHAEEVRYADDKRFGRLWEGFVLQPECSVAREGTALQEFQKAIAERFESRHVHVEICDRARPVLGSEDASLVQVAIYREGRAGDIREFVDGRLDRRPWRPVIEAALTYEPDTGTVEVVAPVAETREELVRMFASHLLGSLFLGDRLRVRQYSLERLREPFSFPHDPEDGIEGVRVNLLRLMPYDSQGERITLECRRGSDRSIWQVAEERLRDQGQRIENYLIVQTQFTISFRATPGRRGKRTLPVRISMPKGCDLKDRTDRERLIGEKYLRRWGLLRDL